MAGLLRPVRGGWIAFRGLEGRAVGRQGRASALVGCILVGLVAAWAGLIAWAAIGIVSEDLSDPNWVDVLWVAAMGIPPVTVAVGLLATAALLAAVGLRGRVPGFLAVAAKLVVGLTALWVMCVCAIVLTAAVESALGGY